MWPRLIFWHRNEELYVCRHKASYCDELVDWPRRVFKVLRAAFSVAVNGGFWIGALFCRGARATRPRRLGSSHLRSNRDLRFQITSLDFSVPRICRAFPLVLVSRFKVLGSEGNVYDMIMLSCFTPWGEDTPERPKNEKQSIWNFMLPAYH